VVIDEGDRIGRFIVERKVGRGAMASVYRVRDVATGTPFALKVLDLAGPQTRERFAQEAEAQSRLRHPNIVALVEVVEVGGQPALVMEFVEGLNLDQLLGREPLEYAMIDRLFAHVCAGVAAAHAEGMVHRDLKPANVLVGEIGGLRVAKVSDFGVVKLLTEADSRLTLGRVHLGTPGFMAPEQAFDPRDVDARADLFSLGCILYWMTTGQMAFPGNHHERFTSAAAGRWTDPRVHVPTLPDRYIQAISACLQVDRDRRPASVSALLDILRPPLPPEPDTMETALADLARVLAPRSIPPAPPAPRPTALSMPPPPSSALRATRTVTPQTVGAAATSGAAPEARPTPATDLPQPIERLSGALPAGVAAPPPVFRVSRSVVPADAAPPDAPLVTVAPPAPPGVRTVRPGAPGVPSAPETPIVPTSSPSARAAELLDDFAPLPAPVATPPSPAAPSSSAAPPSPAEASPPSPSLFLGPGFVAGVAVGCLLAGVGLAFVGALLWLGWSMSGWPRFG